VILDGAVIGARSTVVESIVGAGARIGAHCRIGERVVLGEGVVLGDDNQLAAGARLFPNVSLPDGAIRF
jgi:mannose-1-phosphate guanylyltransferase